VTSLYDTKIHVDLIFIKIVLSAIAHV